jgi:hypothetical protein
MTNSKLSRVKHSNRNFALDIRTMGYNPCILRCEVIVVRFWHKADNSIAPAFVRYWTKAEMARAPIDTIDRVVGE